MTPVARQTPSTPSIILDPSFTASTPNKISTIFANTIRERSAAKQVYQTSVLKEDQNSTANESFALDLLLKNTCQLDGFLTTPSLSSRDKDYDEDLFNFLRPEIDEDLSAPKTILVEKELPFDFLCPESNDILIGSASPFFVEPVKEVDAPQSTEVAWKTATDYENNKAQVKAYLEKNKEKIKAQRAERYKRNKEKIRVYLEKNKEKIKACKAEHYGRNKEKFKKYREKNKQRLKDYRKRLSKKL